jgi:hypothetical protein
MEKWGWYYTQRKEHCRRGQRQPWRRISSLGCRVLRGTDHVAMVTRPGRSDSKVSASEAAPGGGLV